MNSINPSGDIRGVMISVTNARLLLPNATVAEVITYAEPEPVPGAPDWLLGRIRWRGWQLPLVSFARLSGASRTEGELGAKVAVLKSLGDNAKIPYIALLTQGFPRLTTVSADALIPGDELQNAPGVRQSVLLRDDPAVIPDLEGIEAMVGEALAQAAAQVA